MAFVLTAADGTGFVVSFWDLWFAMIVAEECGDDLDRLPALLEQSKPVYLANREGIERKTSHLRDLQERLRGAGLTVGHILAAAGDLVRREDRRARGRILQHDERQREWSDAMVHTPRERRFEMALRGYWPRFPVSPQADAKRMAEQFRSRKLFTDEQSFGLARCIDGYVDEAEKLLSAGEAARAQALLRAMLTVIIELMARADDSYGSIGDVFQRGFKIYLDIVPARTGIDDTVFLSDLLSLLVWEDYGLTWKQTDGYFARLNAGQGRFCIDFFRREVDGLKADRLIYQAERALTLLGQVVAEQKRFELFEPLAAEMGSRQWHRIVQLVDHAMTCGNQVLARRVFEASMTPGDQLEFLTRKYEQLKRGRWNPDPRG